MTSDKRAEELWQAVVHAPDDDAPRLVYADHLLAQGDERAELITVQCALARWSNPDLREREKELLARADLLLGELASIVTDFTITRGFIDDIRIDDRVLSERALEMLVSSRRAQLCTKLRIADTGFPAPDGAVARIATALGGVLGRVRHLVLNRIALGDVGVRALATALHSLTELVLRGNAVGSDGLKALAATGSPTLEVLDLSNNAFDMRGLAALMRGNFPRLAKLDVRRNTLRGDLPSVTSDLRLREVDLSWCSIGDGVATLRDARWLASVHTLDLRGNEIRDKALLRFLGSRHLGALRLLRVDTNELTDAVVGAICALPLDQVTYDHADFTANGLRRLSERFKRP